MIQLLSLTSSLSSIQPCWLSSPDTLSFNSWTKERHCAPCFTSLPRSKWNLTLGNWAEKAGNLAYYSAHSHPLHSACSCLFLPARLLHLWFSWSTFGITVRYNSIQGENNSKETKKKDGQFYSHNVTEIPFGLFCSRSSGVGSKIFS